MKDGFWVQVGAVWGFLAVAMGAFGAHGLKDRLTELGQAANYQTAAQYQCTVPWRFWPWARWFSQAGRARRPASPAGRFLIGSLIFSGSLYLMAVTGARWLGAITPIGGVAMLVGWAALALAAGGQSRPGHSRI